jgi:adenylate cyclase
MESHGEPGRIQVSEAFRNLAADHFVFEERGATDIKSLGTTKTFFLVAAREKA